MLSQRVGRSRPTCKPFDWVNRAMGICDTPFISELLKARHQTEKQTSCLSFHKDKLMKALALQGFKSMIGDVKIELMRRQRIQHQACNVIH